MELIRIKLDPLRRETIHALANPNMFHGALQAASDGTKERILWRVDNVQSTYYLLILTPVELNTSIIVSQFGYENCPAESRSYESLLDRIQDGSTWRFRLAANPTNTIKKNVSYEARGKTVAHVSEKWQMQWLTDKGEKNGFKIDPANTGVVFSKWVTLTKGESKNRVSFKEAVFEGILTVTDAEKFKNVLIDGIGREKAYGMGLLTIIPCRK